MICMFWKMTWSNAEFLYILFKNFFLKISIKLGFVGNFLHDVAALLWYPECSWAICLLALGCTLYPLTSPSSLFLITIKIAPLGIIAIFGRTGLPSSSPDTIYLFLIQNVSLKAVGYLSFMLLVSWLSSAVAKAISPKTLAAAISKAINFSPC